MFGLKLKSWMEAHLPRPRHKSTSHQKAPKDSSSSSAAPVVAATSTSHSSSVCATSSTSNSTSSSSTNSSTNTAIVAVTTTGSNNSTFLNDGISNSTTSDHLPHNLEKNSNFLTRSPDFYSISTTANLSATGAGSESVTTLPTTVEETTLHIKNGGGGCIISKQKGDTTGTKQPDIESHASSESDHRIAPISANCNNSSNNGSGSRPTVTTSVSNSTSILSGSFSNNLSSPDTGYSTDGYSPKSVYPAYPALSFESSSSSSSGNCKSSTSSTSKSSYTISSLASNELLHPSKQTSSPLSPLAGAVCSVQKDLDEYASIAPSPTSPAALTSSTPFSQSCSSGISSGTADSNCFPPGQQQLQVHQQHNAHFEEGSTSLVIQHKQHSIVLDDDNKKREKQQVIMGRDEEVDEGQKGKSSAQAHCLQGDVLSQQKLSAVAAASTFSTSKVDITSSSLSTTTVDPPAKLFSPFSIDFKNPSIVQNKHNGGRTHRRAESMDARTPSHEDYKPLVEKDDIDNEGRCSESGGGNPSLVMTGPKHIRTSFVIDSSGHIVEFSSYKNAYSICSPRRERTRIKTNPWLTPWITVNNKTQSSGDKEPNVNKSNNTSSGSEEDTASNKNILLKSCSLSDEPSSSKPIIALEKRISMNLTETTNGPEGSGPSVNIGEANHIGGESNIVSEPPYWKANPKINKREIDENDQHKQQQQQHERKHEDGEEEHFVIEHSSSSSLLYRISTSASDSGKGSLEPATNRNSMESSCLLSDSTTASTRNSIISHETEQSGSRSGRSSSGESISPTHHHHHHHPVDDDTVGHSSPTSSDPRPPLFSSERQKEQHRRIHQQQHIPITTITEVGINTSGTITEESGKEIRTFRNAAVATDICPEISSSSNNSKFPKGASVSVGVGTTGSATKSGKFPPVMVDKETDILSDWANTDEDGDEDMETDGDRNDNETVTPVPSSPGTDVDRGLFSQSTSSATDIDFGDSSAATQASSTAVFPPSSLISQRNRFRSSCNSNNNNGGKNDDGSGGNRENGTRLYNNEENGFCNGPGESGEALITTSQMVPGSFDHQNHYQHNINMNLPSSAAAAAGVCYPSVPIIRPVLAAVAQHQGPNGIPDAYAYDIATATGVFVNQGGELVNVNHHHTSFHHHPHAGPDVAAMCFAGGVTPNFSLNGDYPEIRESSGSHNHSKGIARGALGFLRKIFKKGACASQRHSPDSVKGKKCRGKSDNNLSTLGLGSPLLTISEPLSNPRYSAVLTTKKQMNPALNGYFLTPTPNSFRRRSGTGTDSSDSKSSKQYNGSSKTVKTDIIRLPPQGTLSSQQQQQKHTGGHATSSSHSSGSSCSGLSGNGIPQQTCSTFLPPPTGSTNFHQQMLGGSDHSGMSATSAAGNIFNLSQSQSNSNTNSTSASSSIHSLMSTSTHSAASAGNNGNLNRPPSQNQCKAPSSSKDPNYYVNSSPANSRQSAFMSNNNGNCNGNNIARGNSRNLSPPPLIPENSPYLNEPKNPQYKNNSTHSQGPQSSYRRDQHSHLQSPAMKGFESPRLSASSNSATTATSATAAAVRMNSPSFNNSYSPIHRLVVTGGSHLINRPNPNCTNTNAPVNPPSVGAGLMHYPQSCGVPSGESPLATPRYNNVHGANGNNNLVSGTVVGNNINPVGAGFLPNRSGSHHHHATSSPSPLINHRHPSSTSSPHQYNNTATSSSQQQHQQNIPGHFFASPSPILRNPRYQYITSSNQNSPVLNTSKRMNVLPNSHSHVQIHPCNGGSGNGSSSNPNGPPPLLTTFAPLPSSSSSSAVAPSPRESLINNNSFNTNTITGSPNLNSSDPFNKRARQVVSSSLSYNEFENLSRQQQTFYLNNGNGNNNQLPFPTSHSPSSHHNQHIISQPQQNLLHQSHKGKIHHQNHYYSSPIVKGAHPPVSLKQTLWNHSFDEQGRMTQNNHHALGRQHQQQRANQNLRFNSFLVGHRQLPQVYHTQWGLQERIYETVDSDGEQTASDEMSACGVDYDQDGNEMDRISELSLPVEVHHRKMKHSYSQNEADRMQRENYLPGQMRESTTTRGMIGYNPDCKVSNGIDVLEDTEQTSKSKSKRSKPKSLSASGRPLPRPVVALPMMPGTFLTMTETRLLEADNESDRKYKRLINEAEALLKEISVEKSKRSGASHDNNLFKLEDCPQSDPLRRKAYDCWALRRLQQELAGCCASPPVLHRSRLNLQSPSTPTVGTHPYLSHLQSIPPPQLPQQVPYISSEIVDNNQNSFEF